MLGRQAGDQINVADCLAAARSQKPEAAAIGRAALLARFHLHYVAVVGVGSNSSRRLALANVANGGALFAQRRAFVDARMKLAIDDGDILVVRLKIEKVVVRIFAAVQQKGDILVSVL